MKATKETIRQKYSILTSKIIYNIYEPVGAYELEFKSFLNKLNKITKQTKKNDLEYTLQEMYLNYTR
jgi:hypothetical protein